MHPNTASAVGVLQDRLRSAQVGDFHRAERYESALDELVRNPERSGPVGYLVRNAASYGLKKTVRRSHLTPRHLSSQIGADEFAVIPEVFTTNDDDAQLRVNLHDLINRTLLVPLDRTIMTAILEGATSEEIASALGEPTSRIRVRISRARTKLRRASRSAAIHPS